MRSRQRFAASQLERVRQASNDRATSQQTLDEAREAVAASDAELAHSASLRAAAQTTVRAAELALEMRTIRAPVAGRIVSLSEAGRALGFVQEGSQVFLLLPDAPLIVRARIEEEFASRIKVGMPAEVFTDSSPQRRFSARVTRLGGILRRQDSDTAPGDRQDVRAMDCVLSLDTTEVLVGQRVLVRFPAAATGALR
jgi:multidrug resistance efflux pump